MNEMLAPLDDPTYQPAHPPVNGRVPEIVARWGAESQLRWFRRFWDELSPMREADLAPFYCQSASHRGLCCVSCLSEQDEGYYYTDECCRLAPVCRLTVP